MSRATKVISIPQAINQKLVRKYPNLSPVELKVAALLSLNLSSREVANITGRSIRTIEFTRSSIRKKVDCPSGGNLVNHLILAIND